MLNIATCQMTSGDDVWANMTIAESLVRSAAKNGSELVLLPEMFPIITEDRRQLLAVAENFGDGPIQQQISSLAKNLGLWICAGSLPLRAENDHITNSCLVYDPYGQVAARYDKIHLFSYESKTEKYNEAEIYKAGKRPCSFSLPLQNGTTLKVGLAICYDLRFPELFRSLGEQDLYLLPAAFTKTTGKAHWEILLRARAIENLAYVCASAQAGISSSGRGFWGHSMSIDPWGNVIEQLNENETGILYTTLDTRLINQVRTSLPALNHRVNYEF